MSKIQRWKRTEKFLSKFIAWPGYILDLGYENDFAQWLCGPLGWRVYGTNYDLDKEPEKLLTEPQKTATAFQVIEHLVEPAPVLKNLRQKELVLTTMLWRRFEKPYWTDDPLDQHFHEFTEEQLFKLLSHCGWNVIAFEKWRSWTTVFGLIRAPKYIAIYAERIR